MRIYTLNINETIGGPNYGDRLNEWLWPKVFNPAMTKIRPDTTFYGIGTIIGIKQPFEGPSYIFGSGCGYWGQPLVDETRTTQFVRGPHSAVHLPENPRSITDPAYLIGRLVAPAAKRDGVGWMPRWDVTPEPSRYKGCKLIRPQDPVDDVIAAINGCELLLTETLHGAITADALRVPWISFARSRKHDFKWLDWCASMDMVWTAVDCNARDATWMIKYGVPQLSAPSTHRRRTEELWEEVGRFNDMVALEAA